MKKILLLFVTVLTLSSCQEDIKPVSDSRNFTNVTMLDAVKDTVPIYIEGNTIYVFNEEGLVEYTINQIDPFDTFFAGASLLVVIVLLIIILDNTTR
tara:strand:+ start:5316 stop:5606 length:291 start_codon:yes stop_codon:yes gene_type:complete